MKDLEEKVKNLVLSVGQSLIALMFIFFIIGAIIYAFVVFDYVSTLAGFFAGLIAFILVITFGICLVFLMFFNIYIFIEIKNSLKKIEEK